MSARRMNVNARSSSSAIAQALGMPELPELRDVAREEQPDRPVDQDAELPRYERQLVQVVCPRDPPAEEAAEREAEDVGDALVPPERRHLAEHAVAVRLRLAGQVFRESPRLAERVLTGGRVERARCCLVRDAGAVAERPHI